MPDLIQFDCPACASTLRIPIELSGRDGPCPVCQQLIVAPNPYTGLGAYLAVATLPPQPVEQPVQQEIPPYVPAFADPDPEPVIRLEPEPLPYVEPQPQLAPFPRQEVIAEAPLPQPEAATPFGGLPQLEPLPEPFQPFDTPPPAAIPEPIPAPAPLPVPAQPAIPAADPAPVPVPLPAPAPAPAPSQENQPFADRLIPKGQELDTEGPIGKPLSAFDHPADAPARRKKKSSKGLIFGALAVLLAAAAGAAFMLKDQLLPPSDLDAPLNPTHPQVPPPPAIPSINPPAPAGKPAPAEKPAATGKQTPGDKPATPKDAAPKAPEKSPDAPAKPPEQSSAKEPAKENTKVVAAAEATLRAFLEAPDWKSRSEYVLSPETIRPKMEAYAKDNADGPTAFDSFSVKASDVDENTKSTLLVFQVEAAGGPVIPVAILETAKGWLVDWESFVEFRDDQFKHFTEGPVDLKGEFHLIVTAAQGPPGTAQENENFAGFSLSPPLPDRQRIAYVRKSNPIYPQLRQAVASGGSITPVLEVAKRSAGDKQSFLEILSIKATSWRPNEK